MFAIIQLCLGTISRLFRSRRTLLLENLALRQQLVVFKRRHPRPRLGSLDKLFWLTARRNLQNDVRESDVGSIARIHGELLMLGFDVSERTISRWMRRAPRNPEPANRWLAFLRNHREAIAAMDFFTMPTITFGALYCFFVIGHDRRKILHFNVTKHSTSMWIGQQLRQAFLFENTPAF
ncbi:MAG TPA: hypothetical protein VG722_04865 [Tepidisphaeraceae bacterium]|nr:hypothetical protein [Tepidisphaeraceae bacterium]